MQNGVIYVAQGANYLDLALQSVETLKAENPDIPVDLFTDQPCDSPLFDQIHPITEGPSSKLGCLPQTRFERTLYLDCDTIILTGLGDLFQILDRFSIAVTHDVRRTSNLIREVGSHDLPYAFPQMNAGVILYRKTPDTMDFLENWKAEYRKLGRKRDQVSFRDLLWSSDIRFYVLPPEFNLRRVTVLDAWEPLDARPTIVHSHRLLQHMRWDGPRMSTLAAILEAERDALAEEWAALETIVGDEQDAARRFHLAEAGTYGDWTPPENAPSPKDG